MNWNERYAVTRKSLREIGSALPEGWEIAGHGQPTSQFWVPHEQSPDASPFAPRRMRTPDVVSLVNRTTGNRAMVLDHSELYQGIDSPEKLNAVRGMMSGYWNFARDGQHIAGMLSHLDSRARGVTLNLGRDSSRPDKYARDCLTRAWVQLPDAQKELGSMVTPTITIGRPKQYDSSKEREILWHPHGTEYENDATGTKSSIDHELGHIAEHALSLRSGELPRSSGQNNYIKSYVGHVYKTAHSLSVSREKPEFHITDPRWAQGHMDTIRKTTSNIAQMSANGTTKSPEYQENFEYLRSLTAPSTYGEKNWYEHYAELYAQHIHPTARKSTFVSSLAHTLGWPKTNGVLDVPKLTERRPWSTGL